MDLFPKDYKKNSLATPSMNGGEASSFSGTLSSLRNKLNFSSGGASVNFNRIRGVILRFGVILSGALLILILLLWGGLYFYKQSLANQIENLKRQQAAVFSAQDKDIAAQIVDFNKRAFLVQSLLKSHIYTSNLFNKLSQATVPLVQWRSFDLSIKDYSVVAKGFAADYLTLSKQMLALGEEGFTNLQTSNISLDKSGGVGFGATFNFDPKLLQK